MVATTIYCELLDNIVQQWEPYKNDSVANRIIRRVFIRLKDDDFELYAALSLFNSLYAKHPTAELSNAILQIQDLIRIVTTQKK